MPLGVALDHIMNKCPAISNRVAKNAITVIEQFAAVKENFAQLWRSAQTIAVFGNIRIDIQGRTSDNRVNIQVQTGLATIAAILLDVAYEQVSTQEGRQAVLEAVRDALLESLNTVWHPTQQKQPGIYQVIGTVP